MQQYIGDTGMGAGGASGGTVDPAATIEDRTVRGPVIEALGLPLPRVWVRCDLKDTVWPDDVDISGLEFVDCDLSGSRWDGVHATDIRIIARERGASKVHGMSMKRASLPGLTMVRVVGLRVDISEASLDDANVRYCSLPRLQARRLHGENAHFCTSTAMDESNWEGAIAPGICFSHASLVGAVLRNAVFC